MNFAAKTNLSPLVLHRALLAFKGIYCTCIESTLVEALFGTSMLVNQLRWLQN